MKNIIKVSNLMRNKLILTHMAADHNSYVPATQACS